MALTKELVRTADSQATALGRRGICTWGMDALLFLDRIAGSIPWWNVPTKLAVRGALKLIREAIELRCGDE